VGQCCEPPGLTVLRRALSERAEARGACLQAEAQPKAAPARA
jgi:hypothetical protein